MPLPKCNDLFIERLIENNSVINSLRCADVLNNHADVESNPHPDFASGHTFNQLFSDPWGYLT